VVDFNKFAASIIKLFINFLQGLDK
jgi:hypothetical protein